mgnify:CR=1 FL=1
MDEEAMSKGQAEYFVKLQKGVDRAYEIAEACRAIGIDAKNRVEIPQAADMASRVHQLLEFLHERNTAEQIRNLREFVFGIHTSSWSEAREG